MTVQTFVYYSVFWFSVLFSPFLLYNAVFSIEKLLKKLFPILSIDKSGKTALIENEKKSSRKSMLACIKASHLSNGNYLTIPFTEKSKQLYIPFLFFVLSLPQLCYLIYVLYVLCSMSFNFIGDVPKVAIVTTVNPCNATDSAAFQSFVKLYKERNEAQIKLNEWTNVIAEKDTPPTMKEYFMQKIQTVEKDIKNLNETLEPEFQRYNDCFFTNNNLKRNNIKNYCYTSWIFFVICAAICCSIAITCSTFLHNVIYPSNEGFGFIEYRTIIMFSLNLMGPLSGCTTFYLQKNLIYDIPEEFLF